MTVHDWNDLEQIRMLRTALAARNSDITNLQSVIETLTAENLRLRSEEFTGSHPFVLISDSE